MVRFTQAKYDAIKTRIGYVFKDRELLRHALTHASTKTKRGDYERLEFLGDRVLGLVIAEELFRLESGGRLPKRYGATSGTKFGFTQTMASVGCSDARTLSTRSSSRAKSNVSAPLPVS